MVSDNLFMFFMKPATTGCAFVQRRDIFKIKIQQQNETFSVDFFCKTLVLYIVIKVGPEY